MSMFWKCHFCGADVLPLQKYEILAMPKKIRLHCNNDYRKTGKSCSEHYRESMNIHNDRQVVREMR